MLKYIVPLIFCLLCLFSCEESIPTDRIESVAEVQARDNGNEGDASDIEVKYRQFGLEEIKNYKAIVLKAQKLTEHDLDFLEALGVSQYLEIAPNEVLPGRGRRFPDSMMDSDGDPITTGVPYRVAVISFPLNADTHLPNIAYSKQDLVLSRNNIVSNFTDQQDVGAGELAIDERGFMMMASYDIINDLTIDDLPISYPISISSSGVTSKFEDIYSFLGGVDSDPEGNFYISNTAQSEILMYSLDGSIEVLKLQGVELEKPSGIFVDSNGSVFIADRLSGAIIEMESDGSASIIARVQEGIFGLTGDHEGNLYASLNTEKGEIVKITPDSKVQVIAQIPTHVPEDYLPRFASWLGHIEYHNGLLYVAGTSTHRIYTVSPDGDVSVFAGSGEKQLPYGDILTADFNRPMGLAFSPDGDVLYVSGCEDTTPQHVQASYPSRVYKIDLVE